MFARPGKRTRKAIRGLMELDLNGVIFDLSEEEVARELRFHRWPAQPIRSRNARPG